MTLEGVRQGVFDDLSSVCDADGAFASVEWSPTVVGALGLEVRPVGSRYDLPRRWHGYDCKYRTGFADPLMKRKN